MIVEAIVRWTEMRIKKTDEEDNELKKILGGETQPDYKPEFFFDTSPMTFDMLDVARFNRSHDKKSVTVRFKDGDSFVVDLSYKSFQELYQSAMGKVITSTLTAAQLAEIDGGASDTIQGSGDDFDIDN